MLKKTAGRSVLQRYMNKRTYCITTFFLYHFLPFTATSIRIAPAITPVLIGNAG